MDNSREAKEQFDSLRRTLARSEAENARLLKQIERLEAASQAKKAELEARTAEVRDWIERAQTASDLCESKYRDVIVEIFQRPSRWSAALTIAVSAASVIISIIVTAIYSSSPADPHATPSQFPWPPGANAAVMPESVKNEPSSPISCEGIVIEQMLAQEFGAERAKRFKQADREIGRRATELSEAAKDEDLLDKLKCVYIGSDIALDHDAVGFLLAKHGLPPCTVLQITPHLMSWDIERVQSLGRWSEALAETGPTKTLDHKLKTINTFMPGGLGVKCKAYGWFGDRFDIEDIEALVDSNKIDAALQVEINTYGYTRENGVAK